MKITYSTISKPGNRSNNEDAFNVIDAPEKGCWMGVVCDGMGGHAMGEVASDTVVKAISKYWDDSSNVPDSAEKVAEACKLASSSVDERADIFNHCTMGTTMVMASIQGSRITVAHIGDSRCYLLRSGYYDVYQTRDHIRLDFGWDVVEKCFLSYHPEVAVPDVAQFDVQPGDRIFICSDGLYKCIAPNILKTRLMDNKPLEDILDVFDFLCERSGDDNYTAILAKID